MSKKILIVDDEPSILLSLRKLLEYHKYSVFCAQGIQEVKKLLNSQTQFDLVIVDLYLPDGHGTNLISFLKQKHPSLQAILMTGKQSIQVTIIEAIKKGIFYFIPKPFESSTLLNLIKTVLKQQDLEKQNAILKSNIKKQFHFNQIVGQSEAMLNLTELMYKVVKSHSHSNLLISGESGTGKELVARSIHNATNSTKPFISVNCGAIPNDLLESEFFGHKKGSFTGAIDYHKGYFEASEDGSLFLDEIGTMDINLQVKLLRVLQEKSFKPVGSTKSIRTAARIIAATNIDLEKAVERGEFRKDLYYRLNIIPLHVPALKNRRQDIPLLIRHFLKQTHNNTNGSISQEAISCLSQYHWPGNIRELENLIERICVFKNQENITIQDIPQKYLAKLEATFSFSPDIPKEGINFNNAVDAYENSLLLKALKKTNWNKKQAAELLKLNRTTLIEKIKKKDLKTP